MNPKIFVDTNVLVYAYDRSEPEKQRSALDILDQLVSHEVGVISTQVLAEFFVAVTHKISSTLKPAEAYTRLENYLVSWVVLEVTGVIILEAARGVRDHSMNFWDAQIWATAKLNQLPVVFSEDFSHGSVIEGVRFFNPFNPRFQIQEWLM